MPAKAIVVSIVLIIMISFTVSAVELFLPLSIRAEMNTLCRKHMLHMELNGGISLEQKEELRERLEDIGFKNIVIDGTENAGYGDEISLMVEADYIYSKMEGLFARTDIIQKMKYHGTSIARKVVN